MVVAPPLPPGCRPETVHAHRCPTCGLPWQHGSPNCRRRDVVRCPRCWWQRVEARARGGGSYRTDLPNSLATESRTRTA